MEYLTIREAMAVLKVSRATLYRMIEAGLPSLGRGRLRRFSLDTTVNWFEHYLRFAPISPRTYACVRCGVWWHLPARVSRQEARCGACYSALGPVLPWPPRNRG